MRWRFIDPLPAAVLVFLAAGGASYWLASPAAARAVWLAGLVLTGSPVVWTTVRGMLRGRFAADLVAMLAVVTAILLQQPLAGLIVVLMQTGGEALERYAGRRASDAVRELEAAAPHTAHVMDGEQVRDVTVDQVRVDDRIMIRPGELVPCDGEVIEGRSHVDASRITGEPIPVSAGPGTALLSGSLNQEGPLVVRATRISSESQYARIVDLVRTAQASKAPLQRVADRYAVWFTPLTLVVCAVAWAFSGDAVRVLAVLVVATPCPLILATPVAIIGGINRAARLRIVLRDGGALERMADATVVVLDKTGTLTEGLPRVDTVVPAAGFTEQDVLRLAGAVETGSGHLLARTLVQAAHEAGLQLPVARDIIEAPGQGVRGRVDGRAIAIGSRRFIESIVPAHALAGLDALAPTGDGLDAFVAVDGRAAGVVRYRDHIRGGAPVLLRQLNELGVQHTIVLSGDQQRNAEAVARALGIADVRGDLLPEDKVDVVQGLIDAGEHVVMVGDGTNDAPALSTATVGIALAGHGGGITAEAADVVLLIDEPVRVADAIRISRSTMRIAHQSLRAGLGLSVIAMVFAALGHIPPTLGALLQEAIDVAVILNALRTTGPTRESPVRSEQNPPLEISAA